MSLVCSISGMPPEEGVFCPVTRCIYEKRLIEKLIDSQGKCPITSKEIHKEDLISIHQLKSVKPRPITATSIPGLMSLFQSEWDSVATETFTLRQHIDSLRNQLAQTLYQHDAATRVIARMLKEKEEMQENIKQLEKLMVAKRHRGEVFDTESGIPEELIKEMQELSKELLASRKKRKSPDLTTPDKIENFKNMESFPLHSASSPGVNSFEIIPSANRRIVTGGQDGQVIIFDCDEKKAIKKMPGHMKPVNSVKSHQREKIVLSASDDKTVRIWRGDDEDDYTCAHVMKAHGAAVKALHIHPLNDYFISCAGDRSWGFFDMTRGCCMRMCNETSCQYNSISFHPDGMIVGCAGADGAIHIWEMKGTQFRASLPGHEGPINDLSFSENGYYLATASDDATIKLWDLRKSLSFETIKTTDEKKSRAVCFDYSGQYIATSSTSVCVYHFKSRGSASLVTELQGHDNAVTHLQFGPEASYLMSSSMDRTVKIWGSS